MTEPLSPCWLQYACIPVAAHTPALYAAYSLAWVRAARVPPGLGPRELRARLFEAGPGADGPPWGGQALGQAAADLEDEPWAVHADWLWAGQAA